MLYYAHPHSPACLPACLELYHSSLSQIHNVIEGGKIDADFLDFPAIARPYLTLTIAKPYSTLSRKLDARKCDPGV